MRVLKLLVYIISSETILDIPVLSERRIVKSEIPTLLYSCSPKTVPFYGHAYPYGPCIGSTPTRDGGENHLIVLQSANTLYGPISFHESRIIKGL